MQSIYKISKVNGLYELSRRDGECFENTPILSYNFDCPKKAFDAMKKLLSRS